MSDIVEDKSTVIMCYLERPVLLTIHNHTSASGVCQPSDGEEVWTQHEWIGQCITQNAVCILLFYGETINRRGKTSLNEASGSKIGNLQSCVVIDCHLSQRRL